MGQNCLMCMLRAYNLKIILLRENVILYLRSHLVTNFLKWINMVIRSLVPCLVKFVYTIITISSHSKKL